MSLRKQKIAKAQNFALSENEQNEIKTVEELTGDPTVRTQPSISEEALERRPSRNIHNLKLDISKSLLPSPMSNVIHEAPETPTLSLVSGSSQVSGVSPKRMYDRSSSHSKHRTMSPKAGKNNLQRQSSIRQGAAKLRSGSKRVKQATESFVGIGKNCSEDYDKWRLRHLKYCSMKYGKLKPEVQQEMDEREMQNGIPTSPIGTFPQIFDPLSRGRTSRYYASGFVTSEGSEGSSCAPSIPPGGPQITSPPPRTPATPGARSAGTSSLRHGAPLSATLRRQGVRQRKDSVARMSWKVVSAVVKGTSVMNDLVGKHQPLEKRSNLLQNIVEAPHGADVEEMDAFFAQEHMQTIVEGDSYVDEVFIASPSAEMASATVHRRPSDGITVEGKAIPSASAPQRVNKVGMQRFLSRIFQRKDKRQYGSGLVGRCLNRQLTRRRVDSHVKRQLDTFDDHRPYFSYWITFVHVVVCIISLAVYGIAPIGFTVFEEKFTTTKKSLARVSEIFVEPQNFWIGPRTKDLIHLGAKYSPCMRQDQKLHEFLEQEKAIERDSACCIRNDDSGCIQTSMEECSSFFATWMKWPEFDPPQYTNKSSGEGELIDRTSGSVCGQDPRFCTEHVVGQADEWPDDITKWPICESPQTKYDNHTPYSQMTCEIVGRPCCIGQEAKCEIVTKEYCDMKRGVFHPEATLCSQVNCMQDTCGLIEFRLPDHPDQIYRLWLSILLHAGLFHCCISVIFQMTVLRDMEKLAGWLRISLIYVFSGIAGNLGSAIFLPYRAEVGPAGSHFGILACLFVEVFQSWQLLRNPGQALSKLVVISIIMFLCGALPWIDNFAHIFGFLSGLLLSFVFLPYITFSKFDKRRKRIQVITCFVSFCAIFTMLIVFFYVKPISDCVNCHYVNCIPFTESFCSNHGFTPTDRT